MIRVSGRRVNGELDLRVAFDMQKNDVACFAGASSPRSASARLHAMKCKVYGVMFGCGLLHVSPTRD